MPRWIQVIRGMIGTALTFAAGVGVIAALVGLAAMLFGEATPLGVARTVGKLSVVTFIVGVSFSGLLALVVRRRTFEKLSLATVTSVGAGAGLLYFLFIAAMNGARVWSPQTALMNFAVLVGIGGVAAAATLLLARRAGRSLRGRESMSSLAAGDIEQSPDRSNERRSDGAASAILRDDRPHRTDDELRD